MCKGIIILKNAPSLTLRIYKMEPNGAPEKSNERILVNQSPVMTNGGIQLNCLVQVEICKCCQHWRTSTRTTVMHLLIIH